MSEKQGWPGFRFPWEVKAGWVAETYCGQCGQMVGKERVEECPMCSVITCLECGGLGDCCYYCGDRVTRREVEGRGG